METKESNNFINRSMIGIVTKIAVKFRSKSISLWAKEEVTKVNHLPSVICTLDVVKFPRADSNVFGLSRS